MAGDAEKQVARRSMADAVKHDAPYKAIFGGRVEDHRRGQGVSHPIGECRYDRGLLVDRSSHCRVRAVGGREGGVRSRAH